MSGDPRRPRVSERVKHFVVGVAAGAALFFVVGGVLTHLASGEKFEYGHLHGRQEALSEIATILRTKVSSGRKSVMIEHLFGVKMTSVDYVTVDGVATVKVSNY
ncbi:MAG: hypothetical protein V3W41_15545 [Planctomycetota bacterium]